MVWKPNTRSKKHSDVSDDNGNERSVPFTFNVAPGKDPSRVYIRVKGLDPSNNFQPCFVTFNETSGYPTYHYGANQNIVSDSQDGSLKNSSSETRDVSSSSREFPPIEDPLQYCQILSSIPKTVHMPLLLSGTIQISIDSPLHDIHPNRLDVASPDYNTPWNMIDISNSKADGICANITALDSFGSPSIALEMTTRLSKGRRGEEQLVKGPIIGYKGDPATFLEDAAQLMEAYAGLGSKWDDLFYHFASLDRITAPKLDSSFDHYYAKYLEQSFLPYYTIRDLHLQTRVGILRGRVDDDLEAFVFYDKGDNVVASLPTFTDGGSTRGWLTGRLEDWPGGLGNYDGASGIGSKAVISDLAKNLSCFLNSGLGKKMTTWDKPISGEYFKEAAEQGKMFKAMYYGQPMYNLYERVMHEAGFNGYSYDHDSTLGRDGLQSSTHANKPFLNIMINF